MTFGQTKPEGRWRKVTRLSARSRLAEGKYAWAENKTEPNHTHGAAFNSTLEQHCCGWADPCSACGMLAAAQLVQRWNLLVPCCSNPAWALSWKLCSGWGFRYPNIQLGLAVVCVFASPLPPAKFVHEPPAYCHCSWLPGYVSLCLGLFWWRISTEAGEQQRKKTPKTVQKALFPCCMLQVSHR